MNGRPLCAESCIWLWAAQARAVNAASQEKWATPGKFKEYREKAEPWMGAR